MNTVAFMAGPVIGGVIGYFTNYIAVKMLFRPHNEICVFGRRLPFTPGIIPKRRGDLARAIGRAISESLLRPEDLSAMLAGDEVTAALVDGIEHTADGFLSDRTLGDCVEAVYGIERTDASLRKAEELVTTQLAAKLRELDLGGKISTIAGETVLERVRGTMLQMFVNADMVASFTGPMAGRINEYILGEGMDELSAYLEREIAEIRAMDAKTTIRYNGETIRAKAREIYQSFIRAHAAELAAHLDIAGTVEEKINAMDIDDLETLILSVMKNELNAIVNLGAVLGFVIGFLNTLVQYLLR